LRFRGFAFADVRFRFFVDFLFFLAFLAIFHALRCLGNSEVLHGRSSLEYS
jgi:hypothetical protein